MNLSRHKPNSPWLLCAVIFTYPQARPRRLLRSSCGSRSRGTGFESRSGRMFFIEIVQSSTVLKLFKGMECVVLSIVHYKEPLKSSDRSKTSGFLLSRYCHNSDNILICYMPKYFLCDTCTFKTKASL